MAEIIQDEGHGKKGGKKRPKKHGTHLDMTPMVDLMCLLITFFMLTTAFNKPKVMQIILPEKVKNPEEQKAPEIAKERALNIIMTDDDKILWYNGLADPTKPPLPTMNMTDYSKDGLRRLLLERNKELFKRIYELNDSVTTGKLEISQDSLESLRRKYFKEDKIGPIILIKAADSVKYRNVVDMIDEMVICNVARYSLTDINLVEKMMVRDFYRAPSSTPAQ
jgi:biopolymer transport protein ExbD